MTPAWTDEDLRCLARDYRNHPDVYDLIEGVRRVLALHQSRQGCCVECCPSSPHAAEHVAYPCATVRALNDPPNGATP